jgi:hypothetical protein
MPNECDTVCLIVSIVWVEVVFLMAWILPIALIAAIVLAGSVVVERLRRCCASEVASSQLAIEPFRCSSVCGDLRDRYCTELIGWRVCGTRQPSCLVKRHGSSSVVEPRVMRDSSG